MQLDSWKCVYRIVDGKDNWSKTRFPPSINSILWMNFFQGHTDLEFWKQYWDKNCFLGWKTKKDRLQSFNFWINARKEICHQKRKARHAHTPADRIGSLEWMAKSWWITFWETKGGEEEEEIGSKAKQTNKQKIKSGSSNCTMGCVWERDGRKGRWKQRPSCAKRLFLSFLFWGKHQNDIQKHKFCKWNRFWSLFVLFRASSRMSTHDSSSSNSAILVNVAVLSLWAMFQMIHNQKFSLCFYAYDFGRNQPFHDSHRQSSCTCRQAYSHVVHL